MSKKNIHPSTQTQTTMRKQLSELVRNGECSKVEANLIASPDLSTQQNTETRLYPLSETISTHNFTLFNTVLILTIQALMENHSNSAIKTATLFGPPHHHTDPTTDPIQLKNILKQALSVLIRELQASKSISSEGFLHQAAQALLEVIKKTPNLAKALREESHQIESLLKTRAVIYGHSDSQAQRQTSTAANNLQTNDSTQHQVPFAATLVDWRENEKSNPTPLPSGKHHGTDEERPNSDDFNLNLIDLG